MRRICFFAAALCFTPALAQADDPPAPDKSGYTLFNPTPDADLRSLCTDRPTKSTSPCTVDAGHWQVESDVYNYTVQTDAGVTTTTQLFTNPTLRSTLLPTSRSPCMMQRAASRPPPAASVTCS